MLCCRLWRSAARWLQGLVLLLELEDLLLVLLQVGGATQIRAIVCLIHIIAVLVVVSQAAADKVFAPITDLGLSWEYHLASV